MKRPRKVTIETYRVTYMRYKYQCPFCHTKVDTNMDRYVTRFLCSHCKNELIVEQKEKEKDNA